MNYRIVRHGDWEEHKYAYKKLVNGKYRYYYDDDDVPDKGLSIKNLNRWKLTLASGLNSADGSFSKSYNSTSYYVNPTMNYYRQKQSNTHTPVSKDIYDHADAMLFYKNEPVKDVLKRKYSEVEKSAKKTISKGKRTVEKTIKKFTKKLKR